VELRQRNHFSMMILELLQNH